MSDLLDVLRDAREVVQAEVNEQRALYEGREALFLRKAGFELSLLARIDAQIEAQQRTERMIAPPRVPTGEQR